MKLVKPITHLTPPYQPHDPDHPDHSDHPSHQPPNPCPTPNKGSHFRCRTFLSKISINISVVKPSQKWVTLIYVALFWAKFKFYCMVVKPITHLTPTDPHPANPTTRPPRPFRPPQPPSPQQGVTLLMSHFFEQNFYWYFSCQTFTKMGHTYWCCTFLSKSYIFV